jgi:glycosyltransferase involved in cell wall biosynthesis
MEKVEYKKNILWITEYPLKGTSFATVTYELALRMPDYHFDILSMGYKGLPLTIAKNARIFEMEKSYQLSYYLQKLKADVSVFFHSFYFLDSLKEYIPSLPGKKIAYVPCEGDLIPLNYRSLFLDFDEIITPSKFSQKSYKNSDLEAKVVPHGVDMDEFKPPTEKWHEFRYGYLGMNDVRKQIPRVMESYARLNKGILALATESQGSYNLKSLSKQYGINPVFVEQKWVGLSMSREAIASFLQTLDCYISPASESFGMPALEAQACGVPIIALDHGAAKEVLGKGALYVSVADMLESSVGKVGMASTADLYRKMRFIIEVPQVRKKTGELALANAKLWPWKNATDKLAEVFDKA